MHSQLEQYLHTVEQNLNALPAEERHNELREIRLHMESLVKANRELGRSEEEAVTHTLAQFGHAQTVGKDLTRIHQRGDKPQFRTLAGTVAFHYFVGTLASLFMSGLVLIAATPSASYSAWGILRGMSTTLFTGWLTGAVMPRYAVRGTLYAHILGAALSTLATLLLPSEVMPMRSTEGFWAALLATMILGTLLAMFGAKHGAQWRNTRNMRNQAMRLVR